MELPLIDLIWDGQTKVIVDGYAWSMPKIDIRNELNAYEMAVIAVAQHINVDVNEVKGNRAVGTFKTGEFMVKHAKLIEYLASKTTEPFESGIYGRHTGNELKDYIAKTQNILNGIINGDFSPVDYLRILVYFDKNIDFDLLVGEGSE